MTINYNPGQIADALSQITTQNARFNDAANEIAGGFKQLVDMSSGLAINAAQEAQTSANALRAENEQNVNALKAAAQKSLEQAQSQDQRFSAIIG